MAYYQQMKHLFTHLPTFLKREGNTVHVERYEQGFLLSTSYHVFHVFHVDVPVFAELVAPYTSFPAEWKCANFPDGKEPATEGGPRAARIWKEWSEATNLCHLSLTRDLREVPHARNKPGTLWRKFLHGNETIWIAKNLCDVFSPDVDELEGFTWQQQKPGMPIRVSHPDYGPLALCMQGNNIDIEKCG